MFCDGREPGVVRVKICGITTAKDAEEAVECGADALGFNFFRGSRRYLNIEPARDWIADLPKDVAKVAVLVNPDWDDAIKLAELPFIDFLQLHGRESAEFCRRLAERKISFIKAWPIVDESSVLSAPEYFTRTILLDSSGERGFGGSGQVFPWELGRRFVQNYPEFQVIVAGGLTPENVGSAVESIRPFGVDVTSGVELAPGRKDRAWIRAFIQAVRETSG